ncbi:MAG: hypothetical protein IKE24_01495 [Clostridia bacterium]|nr:hypothetical protein [Clostridia bacterium]
MKAYFLPLGAGADRSLPAVLSAVGCGAVREFPAVSVFRILNAAPAPLADAMAADLNACRRFFAGKDAFAFFRTEWTLSAWQPVLPGREELAGDENSRLFLSAVRGQSPLSYQADPEAVSWAVSALLEPLAEADSEPPAGSEPLRRLLADIRADLAAGEDVRLLLLCDPAEAWAAGMALGLLRFLRTCFEDGAPFIGLIAAACPRGPGAEAQRSLVRDFLAALRDRSLIRPSEGRETLGGDACWLLGLPSALGREEDATRLLDWETARIMGEVFGSPRVPSPGLHTRELPGTLTLQALDEQARPFAAFLRGACWCICDLFPALHSFFDHPVRLRSLAPATRGGLFRRLFRGSSEPSELALVDRTLRALLLQVLSLLRSLPAPLRSADADSDLWQKAVKACGRAVTLGAEYDVSLKEAEDSGIDKVAPVHRASMSDTEEEELQHKLEAMARELDALLADRQAVFDQVGAFRARQALEDCLNRCQVAEVSARERLVLMPADEPGERYALGLQERRIRLLSAAVSRCKADLETLCLPENLDRPASSSPAPFSGEILDPALAEQAFLLLTAEGERMEAAARALRDGIGTLLKGYPLNDVKMLLKNLLSVCRAPEAEAPLRSLMAGVFSVCGVEVSGLRFQSAGELPALPLLPDMRAESRFFTLSAAPDLVLSPVPRDETAEKRGLLGFLLLREYRRRAGEDAALFLHSFHLSDGPLLRAYLSARGVAEATLVCLRREGESGLKKTLPLAVLLPETGLEIARLSGAEPEDFPSFLLWLDRDTLRFRDPCVYLSEGDRQMLTQQLTRLRAELNAPGSRSFTDFLSDWHTDIMQASKAGEDDGLLPARLRVTCGLFRLPAWKADLRRVSTFFEADLPGDPVCAALTGRTAFPAPVCRLREEITYTFRGAPIARENAARLLESARIPEEKHLLSLLEEECAVLLRSSDDYHEALAAGVQALLDRYPAAELSARETAEAILKEAGEPISDAATELTWPWDTVSASVLTVLTECLGPDFASAALRPFSDLLMLFPARGGEVIGDHLLSACCQIQRDKPDPKPVPPDHAEDALRRSEAASAPVPAEENFASLPDAQASFLPAADEAGAGGISPTGSSDAPSVPADAVLPPLSPEFARVLCRLPQGQSLIQSRFLSFEAENGSVRATLTLEGAFTLKLSRIYRPEEQIPLYAHDLPSLAVWPSIPFPPDHWRAYFSWAHSNGDFRFTVLTHEEERELEGPAPRFALKTDGYPLCFLLSRNGQSIGAMPNLLPVPETASGPVWTASMDFGASATSLALSDGQSCFPLHGPVRMRTLLRSPAAVEDLLWKEFLPGVPVSALLPGALRIFRHEPEDGDLPFRDAVIFMSSSLGDVLDISPQALYTDLKWNGEKGRATRLYLHQVMLMAALEARCGGAAGLGWKAAVPDEMAPEGRERLAAVLRSLAEDVSRESGLPLPDKHPPLLFASESTALGTYFRFCDPEETRGGFMTLDLGADTADLALFLRGRDQAERACQLPLGVHYMLLPTLLARPAALTDDFGFLPEEALRRDLTRLQSLLERASRDPAALRQARYGLDALIADHFPLLLQALTLRRAEGAPGLTGALLLLYFSFLMMLSGLNLLQISVDAQRNDFLPESMTLFLSGRGASLIEALSLQAKTSLWKMLTMFRNPRVSSLRLLFSTEKKMEIPVGLDLMKDASPGLPRPPRIPAAIALRPEELMPEFLLRFRREFPVEAALLFPGIYADDAFEPFTPFGRQLLGQALQIALGDRETGRPYPALIACLTHLLEMLREGIMP